MQTKPKIALIGCQNVAPASAYSLLNGPIGVEVLLIGEHAGQLLRSVTELSELSPLRTVSTIRIGEPSELEDVRVCVLSSGLPPKATDNEDSFLFRNIQLVREKSEMLRHWGFNGALIVTSRPVEIMAHVALEASGLAARAVMGIGSNSARNSSKFGSNPPIVTWCSPDECDVSFIDSCHPDCPNFESMLDRFHKFQTGSTDAASSTMASCVMRVCEAILGNERTVLPVATMLNGQHAVTGTFTIVPCVIGRNGIERILELPLSDAERHDLLDSARETGRLFYRLTKRAASATTGRIS